MAREHDKKERQDDATEKRSDAASLDLAGMHDGGAHSAAGQAAVSRMAHGGVKDLGHLEKPGGVLGNKHEVLGHGQTLRFSTSVNQIWGLGEPTVEPASGLEYVGKELAPNKAHELGSTSLQEYSVTMGKHVQPGTHFKVTFPGHYQVHSDPNWHFSFTIACQ